MQIPGTPADAAKALAAEITAPLHRDLLVKLVVDLSSALCDEGDGWSNDGVDRLRRRVACAVPLADLPDWLKPYRAADPVTLVSSK